MGVDAELVVRTQSVESCAELGHERGDAVAYGGTPGELKVDADAVAVGVGGEKSDELLDEVGATRGGSHDAGDVAPSSIAKAREHEDDLDPGVIGRASCLEVRRTIGEGAGSGEVALSVEPHEAGADVGESVPTLVENLRFALEVAEDDEVVVDAGAGAALGWAPVCGDRRLPCEPPFETSELGSKPFCLCVVIGARMGSPSELACLGRVGRSSPGGGSVLSGCTLARTAGQEEGQQVAWRRQGVRGWEHGSILRRPLNPRREA